MAEQEGEQKRVARVRELEEMVKKLESENRQLLDKVRTNSPTQQHKKIAAQLQKIQDDPSGTSKLKHMDVKMTRQGSLDDLENGILTLEEEEEEPRADEWLFVSPKLPPTPVQKKVTPLQWLSEGHNHKRDANMPSLDEVRKTLVFNINEAEQLTGVNRIIPGAESPPLSPTLRSKQQLPTNRTAQKYLEQVRQRRNSPPSFQLSGSESPLGSSPTLRIRGRPGKEATRVQHNGDSAVPVVKWRKPKLPSESPPPFSDEDEVPQMKWRVKQIPEDSPAGGGGGDTLKIRWNLAMAGQYLSDEDEEEEETFGQQEAIGVANGIPVGKWKARVPQESSNGNVPVVNWKRKPPVETESGGGDVPVVKWKARVPKSDNGDVPVVRWKARAPAEHEPESENIPVVKRRSKVPAEPKPQDEDVPVVRWKAKVPAEQGPQSEDVPVVRRKAKVPAEPGPQSEDVPVVRWKAKVPAQPQPQSEDVPVVRWKAKPVPAEPEPNDSVPVVRWKKAQVPGSSGGGGSPSQTHNLISSRGQGQGLAPPSRRAAAARYYESESGDSEHSGSDASMENLRVSRYTAHQSALQRRSPGTGSSRSPKARHSPQARSRSPSPSMKQPDGSPGLHNSQPGLTPPRQSGAAQRTLSPSSRTNNSGQIGAAAGGRSPSSSPGGVGLRQPRRQLQAPLSAPGQRTAVGAGNGGKHPPDSLHSANQPSATRPSRGTPRTQAQIQAASQQQRTSGLKGSPAVARSGLTPPRGQPGLTPPSGQAKTRRVLPATPPSTGGRLAQGTSAAQQRMKQRIDQQGARPQQVQQHIATGTVAAGDVGDDDDSWLEGCF